LGAGQISLFKVAPKPDAETGVNYGCTEKLPVPPCTPGAAIALAATGGAIYPAFSVAAQCIAPLVVITPKFLIEPGKALAVTWTPASVASARIKVKFDLSHHGGSKGRILCDTSDTGSLQVSASLMDSLVALGVTGFPSVYVARELTSTTPMGSGQVQLKVYSDFIYTAEMPGLVSCFDDTECPTGQTCLKPAQMCGIACTTNADCPTGQTCQTSTKSCK
jgi:Cys-rich repeat protein